jgi:hypothetical protein
MRSLRLSSVAVVVLTPAIAGAAGYVQLAPFSTINAGGSSGSYVASVIEGTTAYNIVSGNGDHRVTRVVGLGGTPSGSTLTSAAQINTANGAALAFLGGGFIGLSGTSDLIFGDTSSDKIYKVNKSTGAINAYVSTGVGNPLNQNVSGGELYYYDSTSGSRRIVRTTGPGSLNTLLSGSTSPTLSAVMGGSDAAAGVAVANGIVYLGNNTADAIFYYNPSNGQSGTALTTSEITDVTNASSVGISGTAFYAAPDGKIYFLETSSDSILSWDPTVGSSSLTTVISSAELTSGPASSDFVQNFTWYDGKLAWSQTLTAGGQVAGLYAIPEPAALSTLAVGAVALLRRRRV